MMANGLRLGGPRSMGKVMVTKKLVLGELAKERGAADPVGTSPERTHIGIDNTEAAIFANQGNWRATMLPAPLAHLSEGAAPSCLGVRWALPLR